MAVECNPFSVGHCYSSWMPLVLKRTLYSGTLAHVMQNLGGRFQFCLCNHHTTTMKAVIFVAHAANRSVIFLVFP
eukprot:1727503-Amphidinium_carterae.2